jgi:anti-anti-sigma regulatory factor
MGSETELRLRLHEGENGRTILVEGELSMATAAGLQAALLDSLQPGREVRLDSTGIATVDLTGLQLLCSAHRTYEAQGAGFVFGGVSEVLRKTAIAAGFDMSHSSCPNRRAGNCLWRLQCQER